MAKALGVFVLAILIPLALITSALAASVEEFYRGKTIQFIVGGSAGGGYDTYTRLIARYFTQYVPGKPSTVVQNMPGAAMLIAANYVFNSAPRDGTVIGHWSGPLILQHMMGILRCNLRGASLAGSVCRRRIPSYALRQIAAG